MATVNKVFKFSLLSYPTLYDCPLDVSIQLFCYPGNGFYWDKNGEISCISSLDDIREEVFKEPTRSGEACLKELEDGFMLEHQAQLIKYQFVKDNIDIILNSDFRSSYFKPSYRQGHNITYDLSSNYNLACNWPENITREWADLLVDFMGWWLSNIAGHYIPSDSRGKEYTKHWPEDISKFYWELKSQRDKLHKILHPYAYDYLQTLKGENNGDSETDLSASTT